MSTMPTYRTNSEFVGGDTGSDPFHDPVILGIGIAVVVVTLVILAVGGVYYWGVLYDAPSWGANSFPPPLTY